MNTRKTIFVSVVVLLLIGLGAWWYLGFSLDFMRFFAAEPGVPDATRTPATSDPINIARGPVPKGCTLQQIQCIQAPCDPIIQCERVACAAQSASVTVGSNITIKAYGGTGGYTFTAPEGEVSLNNTPGGSDSVAEVRYEIPGIKQVLVTSTRATDTTLTDVAACPITITVAPL